MRLLLRLYAALLDLPVQPSATEVLGFGQTTNASPSGLPFRFYEQSRRAPNDPTANRSVFASVDKVPGDTQISRVQSLHILLRAFTFTSEKLIFLELFLSFKYIFFPSVHFFCFGVELYTQSEASELVIKPMQTLL